MRSFAIKMFHGLLYSAPVALLALAACGGGGGNSGSSVVQSLLGGTTSGLTSSGLVLRNTVSGAANDDLNVSGVSGVTGFTFNQRVAQGATYNVSVLTQPGSPSRQGCEVTSGASGVMPASDKQGVIVTCVNLYGLNVNVVYSQHGLELISTYTLDGLPAASAVWSIPVVGVSGNHNFEFSPLFPENTQYDLAVSAPLGAPETCSFAQTASSVSATEVSGVIASNVTFNLICTVP